MLTHIARRIQGWKRGGDSNKLSKKFIRAGEKGNHSRTKNVTTQRGGGKRLTDVLNWVGKSKKKKEAFFKSKRGGGVRGPNRIALGGRE